MTKAEIAQAAFKAVGGDRNTTHGDATVNHRNIAAVWNGILAAAGKLPIEPLTPLDAANMMEGMKIARRYAGAHNVDDYVDGAGYAAVAGEIAEKAEEQKRIDATWIAAARADAAEVERQDVNVGWGRRYVWPASVSVSPQEVFGEIAVRGA